MSIFEKFMQGRQFAQQQALNQMKLAQAQQSMPFEQRLRELQIERESQGIETGRMEQEQAQIDLEGDKAARLRDLATSALSVFNDNPELAQTIIEGGNHRFGLGINASDVTEDDLRSFIAQGFDSEQQLKMSSLVSRQEDQMLRLRELALKEQKFESGKTKLSAGLEKSLLDAQELARTSMQSANEYDVLANDFARIDAPAGTSGQLSEMLKSILGTQDDVTEFRRRFNKVRLSEGLKNLPPGPATDRDVIEAFKGVPDENASKEQRISFLKGAGRLARIDAAYHNFKSDYISENGTAKNLQKGWRSTVYSEKLKREVSNLEVYEAAVNRGITPEDVKERLGI